MGEYSVGQLSLYKNKQFSGGYFYFGSWFQRCLVYNWLAWCILAYGKAEHGIKDTMSPHATHHEGKGGRFPTPQSPSQAPSSDYKFFPWVPCPEPSQHFQLLTKFHFPFLHPFLFLVLTFIM